MADLKIYRRIGLRGAGGICPPGNTIESLVEGIKYGADMLEVDVRGTKDEVLLVSQPSTLLMYGKGVAFHERNYEEWQKYCADTDATLTTLESVLEFVASRTCGILLDIKVAGLENALARLLRRHNVASQRILVAVPSDNSRIVFRALNPNIPIAHKIEADQVGSASMSMIDEIKTDAVFWHSKAVTPERVEKLRKRKIVVYAGPANLAQEIRRLADECQVDGVASEFPDILKGIIP